MTNRVALVIGACNGSGYSTALCLAKSGFHIIGTLSYSPESGQ